MIFVELSYLTWNWSNSGIELYKSVNKLIFDKTDVFSLLNGIDELLIDFWFKSNKYWYRISELNDEFNNCCCCCCNCCGCDSNGTVADVLSRLSADIMSNSSSLKFVTKFCHYLKREEETQCFLGSLNSRTLLKAFCKC